jgi:surface-adhesin protein E
MKISVETAHTFATLLPYATSEVPMPFSIPPYRRLPLTYILGFWSLIILLLLSSGPAYAEWVTVSEDKQEGKTAYVNPDAIRDGSLVKMWTLLDYKTTQKREGSLYMSEQAQHEFDCAEERFRMLALSNYSGNMASGNVVYSSTFDSPETTKWQPFSTGSLAQTLWNFACGKQ